MLLQRVLVQELFGLLGLQRREEHLPHGAVGERAHLAHFARHGHHGESVADALTLVHGHAVSPLADGQDDGGARALLQSRERAGGGLQHRE